MGRWNFNPVNIAVSLGVGWLFMSFLQAAARSLFSGQREGLVSRFKAIAFFHDGRAVAINLAIIAAIGVVTTILWYQAQRR